MFNQQILNTWCVKNFQDLQETLNQGAYVVFSSNKYQDFAVGIIVMLFL